MTEDSKSEKKTELSIKDYSYHNINPFIDDVMVHITSKKYRKSVGNIWQDVLNHKTGELQQQKILILGEQRQVDTQEYAKVFIGEIKKFFSLSKNTITLFQYIMEYIQYSHDRICLIGGDIKEKTGMSVSGIYRSTLQLLEAGIVAKADREGCYFINPTIAFKGDRIVLVKEYRKKQQAANGEIPGMAKEPESEYGSPKETNEEPVTI